MNSVGYVDVASAFKLPLSDSETLELLSWSCFEHQPPVQPCFALRPHCRHIPSPFLLDSFISWWRCRCSLLENALREIDFRYDDLERTRLHFKPFLGFQATLAIPILKVLTKVLSLDSGSSLPNTDCEEGEQGEEAVAIDSHVPCPHIYVNLLPVDTRYDSRFMLPSDPDLVDCELQTESPQLRSRPNLECCQRPQTEAWQFLQTEIPFRPVDTFATTFSHEVVTPQPDDCISRKRSRSVDLTSDVSEFNLEGESGLVGAVAADDCAGPGLEDEGTGTSCVGDMLSECSEYPAKNQWFEDSGIRTSSSKKPKLLGNFMLVSALPRERVNWNTDMDSDSDTDSDLSSSFSTPGCPDSMSWDEGQVRLLAFSTPTERERPFSQHLPCL